MDDIQRTDPPLLAGEQETLLGFLDFLRASVLLKLEGLDEGQLRQLHPPSTMTLLGIVKHLAYVERYWIQRVFLAEDVDLGWTMEDPDGDWRIEPADTHASIVELYAQESRISNRIAATHELDEHQRLDTGARVVHLRWILTHLIEETARHCGHADIIRESIDGRTGE